MLYMMFSAFFPERYYSASVSSLGVLLPLHRGCSVQKLLVLLLLFFGVGICNAVKAEMILFESGMIGETDLPISELLNQNVPGINVNDSIFIGVRFQLDQPVETTAIGGHFVGGIGGTFFGGIVQLDDENDFPDSANLSTDDVLGITEFAFPEVSDEVFGDISLSLEPGNYALVFGSGLFGVQGSGVAVGNNPDIGNTAYISRTADGVWINLQGTSIPFENFRLTVEGLVVPEPSMLLLGLSALLSTMSLRRPNR